MIIILFSKPLQQWMQCFKQSTELAISFYWFVRGWTYSCPSKSLGGLTMWTGRNHVLPMTAWDYLSRSYSQGFCPSLPPCLWLKRQWALHRGTVLQSDVWASEDFIIHSEMLAQSQVSSYVTLKSSLQWGKQTDKEHTLMTSEGQRAAEVLFFLMQ